VTVSGQITGHSLATVYNTLHQFKRAGLVREIAVDGTKAYFDYNTSNHNSRATVGCSIFRATAS